MKNKIMKMVTVMLLLITLTTINFIYVGAGVISLAVENVSTNHKNIEYTAELKDENILTLSVTVKNEGYFNGEITLGNSNFNLTNSSSEFVNKLEGNKITLNQINAGSTASFDVEIEPVKDEKIDTGLLSMESDLILTGIYRDSTEKDINIEATRKVKLEYKESNTQENIENVAELITNKVIDVNGEEKRVIQISMNMGLKENNYPIKEINVNVSLPESEEIPEMVSKVNFNTTTSFEGNLEDDNIVLKLTNEPNDENKIVWKKSGYENIVLTLVYNKDVELEGTVVPIEQTVKLYNEKEITVSNSIEIGNEEKDAIVQISNKSLEETIYKGKINSSLDRSFETETKLSVNLANIEESISIKEDESYYSLNDEQTMLANVVYNKTVLSKDSFDEVLGQTGIITILDESGVMLGTITSATEVDENGNLTIDYEGREPSSIEITTTTPIKEGDLIFTHTKTIKAGEEEKIINANSLVSNVTVDYSTGVTSNSELTMRLEEATTETSVTVNKDTLSTVVSNDIEIRTLLRSNNERYNLYDNPKITIELPEAIENILINSVDLVYDTELSIVDYRVEGKTIVAELSGKQTSYKESSIEGAMIVINATLDVNKKSATQDTKIITTVVNKEESIVAENDIRIVAPTDMTVIHSIPDLGVETIGQEETKVVSLERGTEARDLQTQIEVINNNENTMENLTILGTFPTRSDENNIDTVITQGLNVQGIENVKVYYTENEDATEDIQNEDNRWQEVIVDGSTVRKYLIEVPIIESGTSILATYTTNIPASLEYNQKASQDYVVNYQNTLTNSTNQMKATEISMETGVGPNLETRLLTSISGNDEQSGAIVRNGEVIKYKVEVSNIGSEDISNVLVKGTVPEGTTLVTPKNNYEYTGASYYDELDNSTYEDTIESLGVGEVAIREYEVRVKNDTQVGTNLVNKASITYGDVTKESEESNLVTENGNIRLTVKRVTDENVELYETGNIQYFAIIENISNETQNNIMVKTNLDEALEVSRLNLLTGMPTRDVSDEDLLEMTSEYSEEEETEPVEITEEDLTQDVEGIIESEQIEYQEELNIGSLEPGENKVLSYDLKIKTLEERDTIDFSVVANVSNDEYRSNLVTQNVKTVDVSLSMTSEPDGNYVKAGDTIKYSITVRNNSTQRMSDIIIKDTIPSSLTVSKVTVDGEEVTELEGQNNIEIRCDISAESEMNIEIETLVNYSEGRTEAEAITNVAYAEVLAERVATTTEITHIIEANENQTDGNGSGTNGEQPDNNNNVDDNDVATGSGIITGVAWFDENANGQKDSGEDLIRGVNVQLLNTTTNNLVRKADGTVLEATTNENGVYVLDHVGNGNYIVIFEYDNPAYTLTKYKAEGVSESNNSDAIMKELTINGETGEFASTDIIEVNEENVSNVNVGYIELQNFDLQLEKYVTRIVIQDSSGSTVREYSNETLARTELDAKRVNGATVLIEYKIIVRNVGEVDGYVRRIADYMPNDLNFSSELNKDWYQTGSGLYNESLANDVLSAGESREITLTLTKSMTENNVGLINNTAEIDEAYNELGLADSNSTPGNRVNGENDMGSADVILGIRTGGVIYISIAVAIVAILGIVAYILIRKNKQNREEI